MILVRILLFPFTLLYATAIVLRNLLYKTGVLTRTRFDFPIICVGNIAAGGTGKTPHIEWLIQHLRHEFQLAVLSRGYKRKTVGYQLADAFTTPDMIGDEPFQIKQHYPNIHLAVSENRVLGVPALLGDRPDTQVILMDDGFQHLPIQPGYSIILTDYRKLFVDDWLLPSGTLREFRSAYKRAQCIIVSKCPNEMPETDKQSIRTRIHPVPGQLLLFSTLSYSELQPLYESRVTINSATEVLAFSGIAHNTLFIEELNRQFTSVHAIPYSDHKDYSEKELKEIAARFNALSTSNKILVTTAKDAVKLSSPTAKQILGNLPVYILPVAVLFDEQSERELLNALRKYIHEALDNS
ncbi:MAG: tetraacyldisaccharide 4'-kinase [Bacteroidota bacterium]